MNSGPYILLLKEVEQSPLLKVGENHMDFFILYFVYSCLEFFWLFVPGYEDTKRISIDIPQLPEIPRINKSLYAVENVVRALNANERHVPFRDTKLTRMLQDSIGGASQALMITCLVSHLVTTICEISKIP